MRGSVWNLGSGLSRGAKVRTLLAFNLLLAGLVWLVTRRGELALFVVAWGIGTALPLYHKLAKRPSESLVPHLVNQLVATAAILVGNRAGWMEFCRIN